LKSLIARVDKTVTPTTEWQENPNPVIGDWGFSKPDWIPTAHASRSIAEKSDLRMDRITKPAQNQWQVLPRPEHAEGKDNDANSGEWRRLTEMRVPLLADMVRQLLKAMCERKRIRPGTSLQITEVGEGFYVTPVPEPTEAELAAVFRALGVGRRTKPITAEDEAVTQDEITKNRAEKRRRKA
jgi:hypothetical protein